MCYGAFIANELTLNRQPSMEKTMPAGIQLSRHPSRILLLAALLALPMAAFAQSRSYTLTDLGMLRDSSDCNAAGLNNKGQVVGYCVSNKASPGKFSSTEAFVYADGVMTGLGKLPGLDSSYATAINDNGWIIGSSSNAPSTTGEQIGAPQGFLYRNNTLSVLKGLSGESNIPTGINAGGQIIGFGFGVSGHFGSFLNVDGNVTPLDFSPTAINNSGQIIGYNIGLESKLLSADGASTPLDIRHGTLASPPVAFNDQGQMVGVTVISYGPGIGNAPYPYGAFSQESAYLYAQGAFTYLGFLPGFNQSSPRAINNQGMIVGVANYLGASPPDCNGGLITNLSLYMEHCQPVTSKPSRPFLYADQRLHDLNALLVPAQAALYVLSDASAINDAGQIAATATMHGQSRAVLLTPVSDTPQNQAQNQSGDLVTFQGGLLADSNADTLNAYFEPGPVVGKNGQVFVVALVPTAHGGGIFFMDRQGGWKLFGDCDHVPAYTAPGLLTALANISLPGRAGLTQAGGDITLYLGYGLASAADPAGSACRDMLKFKNYLPLVTL